MKHELSRRAFLGAVGVAIAGCARKTQRLPDRTRALVEIENRIGGRLGVYVLAADSSDAVLSHRGNERFAMCSTFKWALVAAILVKVDQGALTLAHDVEYGERDLLEYAPITRRNVKRARMTIHELAEAAVTVSDNTATNLLLERVGGPVGFTRFLRDHGDTITRLDRNEPMLNANVAGDPRDTTSPQSMVTAMRSLLTTSALSPASRKLLLGWMIASPTGSQRIRAGLPTTWRAGDKTGTGERGAVNDVAIAWPPNRAPVLIAVYMSESSSSLPTLSDAHAQIGRVVASQLGGNGSLPA